MLPEPGGMNDQEWEWKAMLDCVMDARDEVEREKADEEARRERE